jgi:succinyl-CoA synthetase beta subunit
MLEYEGKELLAQAGIATPAEKTAASANEAAQAAAELGYPVVVKAQVLAGGRGKAGGIRLVSSEKDLREAASAILGMTIGEERCALLLVARAADIAGEMYAGITIDDMEGRPVLIFSTQGGMEIESLAKTEPEKVHTMHLSCLTPLKRHTALEFLRRAGTPKALLNPVCDIVQKLAGAFFRFDCTTLEINPLVETRDGGLLALDAKAVMDDSALARQRRVQTDGAPVTEAERRAAAIKVNFVGMEGNVAVIAGGAGLAMATMDMVARCGAKPACFLDTGGGISGANMAEALRICCSYPGVRGVVVNIFGGINNCAEVAAGIAAVVDAEPDMPPLVVKMRGHSQDEGWAMLEERKVPLVKYGATEDAVRSLCGLLEVK